MDLQSVTNIILIVWLVGMTVYFIYKNNQIDKKYKDLMK